MFYLIANLKSNLTKKDFNKYVDIINKGLGLISVYPELSVILCPPAIYLNIFEDIPIKYSYVYLGAQNVSKFSSGPYTGEINSEQVADYCKFCIVGHSERRSNFNESSSDVNQKIGALKIYKIKPIVCVSNAKEYFNIKTQTDGVYVAFEPIENIGTSKIALLPDVENFCKEISVHSIIYGGSVTDENLDSFVMSPSVGGLLIGGAALNPVTLLNIIKKTSKLLKLK